MPRPRILTQAKIEEICELLLKGNYFRIACESAGVSEKTAYEWLKAGDTGIKGSIYVDFMERTREAMAQAETGMVEKIDGARKGWQASLELLKRRFPERWSERVQVTVNSEIEDFLDYLKANLPEATYVEVLKITAARANDVPASQLTIAADVEKKP